MERISVFDIFKIGVGPSSSHTLGPWKAAIEFGQQVESILQVDRVEIHLFGSLSKTGKGHATDLAVQLGLCGHDPKTIDVGLIQNYLNEIEQECILKVGTKSIPFNASTDIIFENTITKEHPNTLVFKAFYEEQLLSEEVYYSVGGGFICQPGRENNESKSVELPYPIDSGEDILRYTAKTGMSISDIVKTNELSFRTGDEVKTSMKEVYNTMLECVYLGCHTEGYLPGGLNVKRRAKRLNDQLLHGKDYDNDGDWIRAIRDGDKTFDEINKWVSCFALAVNEQNAGLGRIVTSPTNGAAGVIPAVMLYYYCFCDYKGTNDLERFLFTAGEIGCIFKKKATISAAVGGCQAEIGVSSAMAAAGLTELMGGSPGQVLMAAEIAMEHHLGLTCDPIGGLVQIPCIERNTMGAMKAITASNLALVTNPDDAIVNFDLVVKAMWDTAQDMNNKYKETSEGGLAFNLPVALPNC